MQRPRVCGPAKPVPRFLLVWRGPGVVICGSLVGPLQPTMNAQSRISIVLAALWWGSLTGLGFVVVPLLFMHLPSPSAAGTMAAKLFTAQTWLGIACAMLLLLVSNRKETLAPVLPAQPAIKFIVAGLLLAVLVEFAVAPRIVSARADGGNLKLWHGLGSAMYLGQWLCAGFALWQLGARAASATAKAQSTPGSAEV